MGTSPPCSSGEGCAPRGLGSAACEPPASALLDSFMAAATTREHFAHAGSARPNNAEKNHARLCVWYRSARFRGPPDRRYIKVARRSFRWIAGIYADVLRGSMINDGQISLSLLVKGKKTKGKRGQTGVLGTAWADCQAPVFACMRDTLAQGCADCSFSAVASADDKRSPSSRMLRERRARVVFLGRFYITRFACCFVYRNGIV